MKKLFFFLIIFGTGFLSGTVFGQATHDEKKEDSKKGGFSVGGFDESRKAAPTRSIPADTKQYEEVAEPAPAPAMEMKEAPVPAESIVPEEAKADVDKAPATDKVKEAVKTRTDAVKNKEKPKKGSRSKGKR